jgi:hypothetical protein
VTITHCGIGSAGRPSNPKTPGAVKRRAVELYREKRRQTDFSTALGNPAKCAGFSFSHRLGGGYGRLTKSDISLATKSGHFNLLTTLGDIGISDLHRATISKRSFAPTFRRIRWI